MTEQEFLDAIDCNFPYRDEAFARRLVLEACGPSANAAFAVLDELARPGKGVDAPIEIRQSLISLLESTLKHPLVPVLVPVARRLVVGENVSVPDACACLNAIRAYPEQYAALTLAYLSCDDRDREADRLNEHIRKSWITA
jgi:hypothetical protein